MSRYYKALWANLVLVLPKFILISHFIPCKWQHRLHSGNLVLGKVVAQLPLTTAQNSPAMQKLNIRDFLDKQLKLTTQASSSSFSQTENKNWSFIKASWKVTASLQRSLVAVCYRTGSAPGVRISHPGVGSQSCAALCTCTTLGAV